MRELRWPLHPRPIQEECVLSWLTRIANCYDFTLDELLKLDLGYQGNPDDLNIKIPDFLLTLLSKRTGVSEQDIYALTISSLTPLFLDELELETSDFESYVHYYSVLIPWYKRKKLLPKKPWKPWFSKSWSIVRACPVCVESESKDSTLLIWSLPIMLSCPLHKCYLRLCRTYQGCFWGWQNENESLDEPSPAIQMMDQRTWSAITTGQVTLPRRTVHGGVWFRLLRTLLDELQVAISSLNPSYAKMIGDIWVSLGLEVRAGQKVWRPYEELSFEIQNKTLMAAAAAIEKIENESIIPRGREAHLLLSEPLIDGDLPQHSASTVQEPKSAWQKMIRSLNEVIEIAKHDPTEAINFRNLLLFGKNDPESIQKVNKIMFDAGIPKEFIVT